VEATDGPSRADQSPEKDFLKKIKYISSFPELIASNEKLQRKYNLTANRNGEI